MWGGAEADADPGENAVNAQPIHPSVFPPPRASSFQTVEKPKDKVKSERRGLRYILPAAENLAKAVGTTQAKRLLDLAYAGLPAGEEETKEKDIKELQGNLDGALGALIKLHQTARTAAEAADTDDHEDGNGLLVALWMCEDESLSGLRERLAPFQELSSLFVPSLHAAVKTRK
ncbi:hypothetical protein Esti_005969 [Eimeria stiedai]